MSLTAFKRKSVIQYGSDRSGKPPGGIWLPQGPFGSETTALQIAKNTYGNSGFSLNGGHRNVGGVGQDMKMSKSGTPYRGVNPIGWGGTLGTYPSAELVGPFGGAVSNSSKTAVVQPLLNGRFAAVANTQLYIKPSVLSTYGMLRKNTDGLIMVNIRIIGFNQIIQEIKQILQVNGYIFKTKQQQMFVNSVLIMLEPILAILKQQDLHYVLQAGQQQCLHIMIWQEMLPIQKLYINLFLILNTIYILLEVATTLKAYKNPSHLQSLQEAVKRRVEQVLPVLVLVAIHPITI